MSSEVQMIGSWASLWFALYGTGRGTSPFLTPMQKRLHEIELKLLKIQLMITKLKRCLDNANDDDRKVLKQMIAGSIQEVSQRMDCIPWKTMLTMISALNSEASRSDTLDCASTECNLTLLSAFVFWVEKLLEIALMRSEAICEIDLCRSAVISLDQSFLEKWLPKFDWIHDKALTVARLFSYFQDDLCSERCNKEKALIWLCKKVSSPHFLNIFDNGDQSRATQEVICLANEWYCEYRKVIEVEVREEIEEAKDQAMNKAFVLFV
jgi:hypothetical protein